MWVWAFGSFCRRYSVEGVHLLGDHWHNNRTLGSPDRNTENSLHTLNYFGVIAVGNLSLLLIFHDPKFSKASHSLRSRGGGQTCSDGGWVCNGGEKSCGQASSVCSSYRAGDDLHKDVSSAGETGSWAKGLPSSCSGRPGFAKFSYLIWNSTYPTLQLNRASSF